MISVLIVLIVVLISINAVNYHNYLKEADERLTMIEMADGNLSDMREKGEPPENISNGKSDSKPPEKPSGDPQMAEAPYDTRYFSAELDSEKSVISLNMTDIASVTEAQAEKMISRATESGRTEDSMGVYRYRISADDNGHYLIVFLNVSRDFASVRSFFNASVVVGAIGVVEIFILMRFLTRIAMAPAETAFEKQKKFITDASHEIKTPLAIIESNTEVIEIENGESKWTTNIRNQITRLTALTEKLVLLSRMDEAGYQTKLMSFDLSELLKSISAEYKGRQINIEAPDYLPHYGSKENISRMFSMLFDNAMKYSTGDISVQLSGTPKTYNKIKKHGYTIFFNNPCEKIEPGGHDELLDRFSRMDKSRSRKTGGSGIGLAVVSEIVKYHKGEVHVFSTDGKTFIVKIQL